jgi:hypothetical protein
MSDKPDDQPSDAPTDSPDGSDNAEAGVGTSWAFWGAAIVLMVPPLIPILAAFAPSLVPLPIDMSVPDEASGTGWTMFLVGLGAVLLLVNLTVLYALRRWADQ